MPALTDPSYFLLCRHWKAAEGSPVYNNTIIIPPWGLTLVIDQGSSLCGAYDAASTRLRDSCTAVGLYHGCFPLVPSNLLRFVRHVFYLPESPCSRRATRCHLRNLSACVRSPLVHEYLVQAQDCQYAHLAAVLDHSFCMLHGILDSFRQSGKS